MPATNRPGANDPGKVLRGGEFYSPVQSRLRAGDVLLSELRQPVSRAVPRHEHELAYVTIVLSGHYLEGDRRLDEMLPFTAVFNPSGIKHSTVIGPAGASFFTIEFRDQALKELSLRLPTDTTFDRGAGAMLWPGLRLYSAFKTANADPHALDACVLEGCVLEACVLEIIGALTAFESPAVARESRAPRWFRRVKERLHEEFRGPVRMSELARDAGVHPVHLARVFRKFESRTPGEYQQRLQVRAACELLRDLEWPLAAIAAECGFADQSHLTRIFRRMTGTTPAQFRRALLPQRIAA
ncbi:MAG TPA: AraC family transcriptional regulator [Candidatus Solibacter sp.]|nr:AraC family transcriptional regulator [Candidatus Solibacter sp.]